MDQHAQARHLRELHTIGQPLVLINAWDVASAREIEAAGSAAIATSSAAFAASIGAADGNTMPVDPIFDFVRRVAEGAGVPVTVDLEGG
jgi:2-methylisocitrate lyase-like PEP mutase family enzyme